jgi:hypothetical protein
MMIEGSGSGSIAGSGSGSIPLTVDPDPGCPKTRGSGGSGFGSAILVKIFEFLDADPGKTSQIRNTAFYFQLTQVLRNALHAVGEDSVGQLTHLRRDNLNAFLRDAKDGFQPGKEIPIRIPRRRRSLSSKFIYKCVRYTPPPPPHPLQTALILKYLVNWDLFTVMRIRKSGLFIVYP